MSAVRANTRRPFNISATAVLLVGVLYSLMPVLWIVIASTKSNSELFSTPTYLPAFNGSFWDNIVGLFSYKNGIFLRWTLNSFIYSVGGGLLSTVIAVAAGYALGKYRFLGSKAIFRVIVAGVLLPPIVLAIPQYLMLARFGFTNNYLSVILPLAVSPYAIYLCKIYAEASVPDEIMEAARIDGSSEWQVFRSVGVRMMMPAVTTVFLLQFIGTWNNFLLPSIMLSSDRLYPLTLGLYGMLRVSGGQAALYSFVIMGSLLSVVPVSLLFLSLQRFWRVDLLSGGVKA